MEKYSYQKVLGMGNFGKAWLVRSRESRRPYVIKEVSVVGMGEKERERAVNEVAILGRLRHVNIIRYREAFVAGGGGLLAIVMEYGDGGDLAEKIEEAKRSGESFSGQQVLNWFVQLCLALYYMHSEKVLHRDLKPSNLFLTSKGIIKVGDFGIAKMLRHTLDHASTAIGTPYYLSPEICQRQPYNQKSDMWAAGCILYELVTLTRPFEGEELSTLIMRILGGLYTPIPRSYGTVIEELVAVLLSVSPDMRPSAHAILTSHNIRPYVKAFTDRREVLTPSPSPSSENRCKTRSRNPELRESSSIKATNSPYAITTNSKQPHASRHVRRFHQPVPSACDPTEQRKSLKRRCDSPLVKDDICTSVTKRPKGMKYRIVHHQSASEPVHLVDVRTPLSRHKPVRALSQRKPSKRAPPVAAPLLPDSSSGYVAGSRQLYGRYTKRRDSLSAGTDQQKLQEQLLKKKSQSTPSSISRKRRSEEIDGSASDPHHHYILDIAQQSPAKKRRQSLPDRVKESKFLSRLVSSESISSKHPQSKQSEKNELQTKHHQENGRHSRDLLKRKNRRRKSEPVTKMMEAQENELRTPGDAHEVNKIPRTTPATRAYRRPRIGSNAPITCLFPKALPETSSRPRTRIKHGTYTLNLPNLSADAAPSKCGQCQCRQNRVVSSKSNADANVLENKTSSNSDATVLENKWTHTPAEKRRDACKRKMGDDGFVPGPSFDFEVTGSSPVGNFRRRNALRRRSRDYVPPHLKGKTLRTENDNSSSGKCSRLGAKPDLIPHDDDEVFLLPAEQEQPSHSGRTNKRDDLEIRHDLEIAEFLHAGMEKPGEDTTELRSKLELLKMFLERRLGTERSSVAYSILSSASCIQKRLGTRENSVWSSGDVVRLVADVLGPGKMCYFPILVEVVNLSNRCH